MFKTHYYFGNKIRKALDTYVAQRFIYPVSQSRFLIDVVKKHLVLTNKYT
jgi:hypothetical protein